MQRQCYICTVVKWGVLNKFAYYFNKNAIWDINFIPLHNSLVEVPIQFQKIQIILISPKESKHISYGQIL